MNPADISTSLHRLRKYVEGEKFRGYDPFDALTSPMLRALSLSRKYIRIAMIQGMRRLPANIRPFLSIHKGLNPKGIGLFLWGYAKLYRVERKVEYLETMESLLNLLGRLRSRGYSGNCWGYNFDWQSRAFYIARHTPTLVNSSFIGHALIDAYRYARQEKALEMAVSIKEFILKDLNRREEDGTICFSYTPVDNTAVHNANLLGASLLIRLYGYTGEERLKEAALASLEYSIKHQRDDGSWYYAESKSQRWIDSFHTGFNLMCILYFLEQGFGDVHRHSFERGVSFYSENFFLEDGRAKYYHDRLYPIDIHSLAQAVVFFSRMGEGYRELTEKITRWMILHMQDGRGFFYFQRRRLYTVRIPYIRWAQAWAFHALTEYLLNQASG
ncbi:MAG: delta-aminolevulinic acid dehydratase [Deltaproteobacteria bacterium]|nr:delta-aminolevulinic acid dehydratase [Deltaproteobacteria bacterium]